MNTYVEMARKLFTWALDYDKTGRTLDLVNEWFDLDDSYNTKPTKAKAAILAIRSHELATVYHWTFGGSA